MAPFIGGSASAMAAQVGEGYTLLTAIQLRRLSPDEVHQLAFELERALRDQRSQFVATEDLPALQLRNRKIARLSGALQLLRADRTRRR